jgi:D-alanyl-lipoteichoic acid acyltransferase DltB (MBOAT superfamily)
LALYISNVYDHPRDHQGLTLITATFFLAFQIYADFSGYTDMARGIAHILGIDLFENFRQPYLSKSILEFWRRWHISLSTWIREYLFFPLSRYLLTRTKRRNPRLVEVITYLIIMSVVGLWHGASWSFVVWGVLHGIYMGIETVFNARRIQFLPSGSATDVLKIISTFLLVTFAWIFFRTQTLNDAAYIIANMLNFGGDFASSFNVYGVTSEGYASQLLLSLTLIAILVVTDLIDVKWGIFDLFKGVPVLLRFGFYYAIIALIFGVLISARVIQNFVYFQF